MDIINELNRLIIKNVLLKNEYNRLRMYGTDFSNSHAYAYAYDTIFCDSLKNSTGVFTKEKFMEYVKTLGG